MLKKSWHLVTIFVSSYVSTLWYYSEKNVESPLYSKVVMPLIHKLDAENAQNLMKFMLKWGLGPKAKPDLYDGSNPNAPDLVSSQLNLLTQVLGYPFDSPIGLAAGFDRDAECMEAVEQLGFGFMEVGSVFPLPQRAHYSKTFRTHSQGNNSNRPVFDTLIQTHSGRGNSKGMDYIHDQLHAYREKRNKYSNGYFRVGVNLGGTNVGTSPSSSMQSVDDYVNGIKKLSKYADYMVIHVNSPMDQWYQDENSMEELLEKASAEIRQQSLSCSRQIPLLVKITPDLTLNQQQELATLVLKHKIDGIIVSNTTRIERSFVSQAHLPESVLNPDLNMIEVSGRPLFSKSTTVLKNMYKLTDGKVTLIGVGGVWDGHDALQKIEAGASLVQVYTSFTAQGPAVIGRIKRELSQLLKERGYKNVSEAVGAKAKLSELDE